MVFSTPLRPGGLILRHRYHTLLGFGSCEITVGNQSLFDNFFTVGGSSEIRTRGGEEGERITDRDRERGEIEERGTFMCQGWPISSSLKCPTPKQQEEERLQLKVLLIKANPTLGSAKVNPDVPLLNLFSAHS